jgi:hypothetical protein
MCLFALTENTTSVVKTENLFNDLSMCKYYGYLSAQCTLYDYFDTVILYVATPWIISTTATNLNGTQT